MAEKQLSTIVKYQNLKVLSKRSSSPKTFNFVFFFYGLLHFEKNMKLFPFLLMPELSYGNHFKLMNYLKALIPQNGKANNFRV